MTEMVDWGLAVSIGSRLAGAGPEVTAEEAEATVAELREGAEKSTSYVRDYTGLDAGALTAPVLVVDRPAWIQANAEGFAQIITPVIAKVTEKKGPPGPISQAVGSPTTGAAGGGLPRLRARQGLGQL